MSLVNSLSVIFRRVSALSRPMSCDLVQWHMATTCVPSPNGVTRWQQWLELSGARQLEAISSSDYTRYQILTPAKDIVQQIDKAPAADEVGGLLPS